MSSIAVWSKSDNSHDAKSVTIDKLHFNLWFYEIKRDSAISFDFGLLVNEFEGVDTLCVYFPFGFNKTDVSDLGKLLTNAELLGAVFNDELQIDSVNGKASYIHPLSPNESNSESPFLLYELDIENDVIVENIACADGSGSILIIDFSKLQNLIEASDNRSCRRCYIRLRITSKSFADSFIFGRNFNKFDSLFHDALSTIKFIDFRVNQDRSLPKSLVERVDKEGGYLNIAALHFLMLTKDSTIISSDDSEKVRRLEPRIWSNYIPSELSKAQYEASDILAHHWKQKNGSKDLFKTWDIFIGANFVQKNLKNIFAYILFAILLGVVIDFLVNMLAGFLGFALFLLIMLVIFVVIFFK